MYSQSVWGCGSTCYQDRLATQCNIFVYISVIVEKNIRFTGHYVSGRKIQKKLVPVVLPLYVEFSHNNYLESPNTEILQKICQPAFLSNQPFIHQYRLCFLSRRAFRGQLYRDALIAQ